ncbi:MAG TPA: aconitate hydratase AcnA [Anaerolineaceae bacterium]|nr:aconitate hydratase AcnA [Anaerolineaceae bacterium]
MITSPIPTLPILAGDRLQALPFSLRILLENALRCSIKDPAAAIAVEAILNWQPQQPDRPAIPYYPARVLLQDLTGVPLVVDLAAMRSAAARLGLDPSKIAPQIPVDLVIDHSAQVDFTGGPDPLGQNLALEYERNRERYQLLRWAQAAFNNFRVVPPGKGIIHQINLESLATVVTHRIENRQATFYPDTLVGTDSHTPMVNGLGVLGWGVGGIEAIAAMLGKPLDLVLPDVIGLELVGELPEGVTPTDLTLTIVERLRREGVVDKFIECFGAGLDRITVPDRAMIANMSPESGATVTLFPVDEQTLAYLRLTGRDPEHIDRVKAYCLSQGLFRETGAKQPEFSQVIRVDLTQIQSSLAGPFRPNDRISLPDIGKSFRERLTKDRFSGGFSLTADQVNLKVPVTLDDKTVTLRQGALVIAAITSCTNTSNPMVMLSAGLLAQKAVARGLKVNPAVKCSLMPGSRVVTAYLRNAGVLDSLAELGFNLVGYGCGSCIGNSGPLAPEVVESLKGQPLVTASVSSGNRNFDGRIHPLSRANYLASPPLVVAYALAGTVNIDLEKEPLGTDQAGQPVYLREIFPSEDEVRSLMDAIQTTLFKEVYSNLFEGDEAWQKIGAGKVKALYPWDKTSTYIKEPPYFNALNSLNPPNHLKGVQGARVLALLGDSITTDHISPAGTIPADSPAGKYLLGLGIAQKNFNTYGTRRGNDEVMARGTFSNIRLKNKLLPEVEGGWTKLLPEGDQTTIFEASQVYRERNIPLIVIAGKEYGTGSSRDWAAKGPLLLGVRAVIAESFERIHRANLVGMGILPLQFEPGENAESLGLTGEELFDLSGLDNIDPQGTSRVTVHREDGTVFEFSTVLRIDTSAELAGFKLGGILHEALLR